MAELPNVPDQVHPPQPGENDVDFPYAPPGWSRERAREQAKAAGMQVTDDHWRAVHALQQYYATHEPEARSLERLTGMLDAHFRPEGGMQYLHTIFPKGPVAQGCRLAGLEPPADAEATGFGSEP